MAKLRMRSQKERLALGEAQQIYASDQPDPHQGNSSRSEYRRQTPMDN